MAQYIGDMIRRHREAMGPEWTQDLLAERLFVSQSYVSKLERGIAFLDRSLADRVEHVLGIPAGSLVNLVRVREKTTVSDYAAPFIDRQEEAVMFSCVSLLVPGLLQTEDYARELLLAGQAGDPRDIDSFVHQRMERQSVWSRPDPPWFNAVLDESALYRATATQIQRLLDAQAQPNITIQILPFGDGHISGTTYTLTLPSGARAAYTEGFHTGQYTEEVAEVLRYQRVYDRFASRALAADASTGMITEALKRYT
ncbi:Scr1 family TA system antitoxin-like transcriptional regulator [Streptomyces sp. NPDC048416]|uniref:helix-turn-helix domain-containing protein n=1 Tax=Streptomyces sp. NPDC048416 TaxID=3365546 RepID=UPI00371E7D4D